MNGAHPLLHARKRHLDGRDRQLEAARRLLTVLFLAGLPACSECCTDADCAQQNPATPLCVEGGCRAGLPVPEAAASCDIDADCGADALCFDEVCAPTASCQRLQASFVGTLLNNDDDPQDARVFATTAGCAITMEIQLNGPDPIVVTAGRLAVNGTFEGLSGATNGTYDAARRVGSLSLEVGQLRFLTENFPCQQESDCADQVGPCLEGVCGSGVPE